MLGVDLDKLEQLVTRLEAVAERQSEAAQQTADAAYQMENAAESFGSYVSNMEASLQRDRRARREYT